MPESNVNLLILGFQENKMLGITEFHGSHIEETSKVDLLQFVEFSYVVEFHEICQEKTPETCDFKNDFLNCLKSANVLNKVCTK